MKGRWEKIATETRWGRYVSNVEELLILDAASRLPEPGHMLEIGCETGRWCRMLATGGWQVTGTDVNADALAICRTHLPDGEFIHVDNDDRMLPLADKMVDLLLCVEVAPIMNSPWFAAEAARILRPGGVLMGVAWNLASWRGAIVAGREALSGRRHGSYQHSWVSQRRRFLRQGFRFQKEQGFCWLPFTRESDSPLVPTLTKLEALGPRKLPAVSPWVGFIATVGAGEAGERPNGV